MQLEMAQEDFPVEPVTLEVDLMKESVLMADHKLIRKATDEVISFITKGLIRLKDASAI